MWSWEFSCKNPALLIFWVGVCLHWTFTARSLPSAIPSLNFVLELRSVCLCLASARVHRYTALVTKHLDKIKIKKISHSIFSCVQFCSGSGHILQNFKRHPAPSNFSIFQHIWCNIQLVKPSAAQIRTGWQWCFYRNNCTYCGGGIEDNYPPAGIAAALLLFPIGIVICCILKERQCVKCNRTAA